MQPRKSNLGKEGWWDRLKDLFELGIQELKAFRRRAARLYTMDRLSKADWEELDRQVEQLLNTVEGMRTRDQEESQLAGGIPL